MDLGKDTVLGDYLLGKLPEDEEVRLETEFLANAEHRERLEAVEAELIDAYLKGELSRSERRELETRFLASPRGQERLQFARTWMGAAPRARASSGSTAWLMAAAALVAVALSAAVVWMSIPQERGREIAENDRGTPTPPLPAASTTRVPTDGPPSQSRPREHGNDLYAGISRGTSGVNEIRIDATSPEVRLALHLDRDNHRAYDVALVDTGWRQKGVRSERTADGPSIRVVVPAALLLAGKEYTLVVSPASSPERPIRAYLFKVEPGPPSE
jgi:hypothetical protein